MCSDCGGGKQVPSPIQILSEDKYGLFFLMCVYSKEEVVREVNNPISNLSKNKVNCWTLVVILLMK